MITNQGGVHALTYFDRLFFLSTIATVYIPTAGRHIIPSGLYVIISLPSVSVRARHVTMWNALRDSSEGRLLVSLRQHPFVTSLYRRPLLHETTYVSGLHWTPDKIRQDLIEAVNSGREHMNGCLRGVGGTLISSRRPRRAKKKGPVPLFLF